MTVNTKNVMSHERRGEPPSRYALHSAYTSNSTLRRLNLRDGERDGTGNAANNELCALETINFMFVCVINDINLFHIINHLKKQQLRELDAIDESSSKW